MYCISMLTFNNWEVYSGMLVMPVYYTNVLHDVACVSWNISF